MKKNKVLIIAELGLNHNGNFNLALQMIDKAKEAGVDGVKFQVYNPDLFINKKYASEQYEIFKKYYLSFDKIEKLINYAKRKKLLATGSFFDLESLNFLIKLKPPFLKVASSEVKSISLLKKASQSKIPLVVSTGLVTLEELKKSIDLIKKYNKNIILLHCISEYPLKPERANMRTITFLKEKFKLPVGFSDHSETIILPVIAVSLGACMIEKHFTLDKNLKGPDHKFSFDFYQMKELVKTIRTVEKSLGKPEKIVTPQEKRIRKYALKSYYALKEIKKGEKITEDKIVYQRPYNKKSNIKPVGKIAPRDIKRGEPVFL